MGDDCPVGMVCEPWFDDGKTPPGLKAVGICVNPGA